MFLGTVRQPEKNQEINIFISKTPNNVKTPLQQNKQEKRNQFMQLCNITCKTENSV